ncbi:MAG: rhodanese-like domain-containing protein [Parcubacteria group bacterium]|jgi:rhodanese-related sulfurtransferase
MHQNNNQPKNNLLPITIGFFLIVIVTSLFFVKSSWMNKKKEATFVKNQEQEKEDDLQKYSSISTKELLKKITSDEKIEIIDIRDAQSFSQSHIVDAKNIVLDELTTNFSFIEKNKNYFIVDDLGLTPNEKQVMDIFAKNGFRNVSYLEGGIYAWTNELNPIVEIGNPNSFSNQAKVNYIKNEELKNLTEQDGESLYLVDLRSASEFASDHLKSAVNIPLENLESRRKEIPTYKRIILYDNTGLLAFQGAVRLFDMGILNVSALTDGLNAWKQKGFEVVK